MRPPDLKNFAAAPAFREALERAYRDRGMAPPNGAPPEITYVRFKPGVACLLGLRVTAEDGGIHDGYVKVFYQDDPRTAHEKYRVRGKRDGWVAVLPEVGALYFHFPLDRAVDGLPYVTDVQKLKHLVHRTAADFSPEETRIRGKKSAVSLIKYKPERRCIVRADMATIRSETGEHGKAVMVAQANADEGGERIFRLMEHLHDGGRGKGSELRVPRPLGYDPESRVLLQEWVEGEPLSAILNRPGVAEACARTARALQELHEIPPVDLPRKEPRESVAHGCRVMQDLRGLGKRFGPMLDPIERRMERLAGMIGGSAPAVVHGDFYYHQVLVRKDRCTLLDWDEAHVGDPLSDVGNFIAHLYLLDVEGRLGRVYVEALRDQFLVGYFRKKRIPREILYYVAIHLLDLALVPFRNLRDRWEDESEAILARVDSLLRMSEKKKVSR